MGSHLLLPFYSFNHNHRIAAKPTIRDPVECTQHLTIIHPPSQMSKVNGNVRDRCGKEGCWSTKHPVGERNRVRKQCLQMCKEDNHHQIRHNTPATSSFLLDPTVHPKAAMQRLGGGTIAISTTHSSVQNGESCSITGGLSLATTT
jgi:hypothetical protein